MRTAIYPGSFDPVTNGHLDLVSRASGMFDKIIVAVVANGMKPYLFDLEERVELVRGAISSMQNVNVVPFSGLLAKFVEESEAVAIIRGLRAVSDFEYEFQLALMNRELANRAETVFLMPSLSYVYISSSLIKEVAKNGGDISAFVPAAVEDALRKKFPNVT
ncbi:MAG: pantetheine-phosphate adenylyltransferase [candidate division Zixibacteria bacterium]|nr:pantetheine-phosphate adenylyltransferase [candidate division Zixibacteria bacterium]MBU1469196.1 pantetheine-phosphate adenylyltransferase [candidate division Zixibacteria bacterium]MBU2626566.1 pantetheine-phosphate adenylyltransferase [candidate division Zixibacteria bacterium]